ncbi:MAG: hypothetical protein LBP89_09315 [Helicobacteraceae bacterium]|jgi:hypothetical protein|nr:hypothetical protein [Helicobacteraceae bacterium]
MKTVKVLSAVVLLALTPMIAADSDMVSSRDLADFYLSDRLKEEIKAAITADINASLEGAKTELLERLRAENERSRRFDVAQIEELSRQIAKLKEEIDFARELAVDSNYMRNSNDDIVFNLQKRFDEINDRIKAIELKVNQEPTPPELPVGGRKL